MKQENEFLALVYGPPVYFETMTIKELQSKAHRIQSLLLLWRSINTEDLAQLKEYCEIYKNRIKHLNKQYSI